MARVHEITEHGIFVRIGNSRFGYIPVEEISDSFRGNPRELFCRNDMLKAVVVVIGEGGKRLTLSLKALSTLGQKEPIQPPAKRDLSFQELYRRYQKESQERLAALRKNIEAKGGEL